MTHEQVVHDRVNLVRLVRRLKKSVAYEHPEAQRAQESKRNVYVNWARTQGTLQTLKYAQTLLNSVEANDDPMNARIDHNSLRETLNRLEGMAKEMNERVVPKPTKPPLMLPRMPQPVEPPPESLKDLLLSPDTPPPPIIDTKPTSPSTQRALQSSSAVHEELSSQLAQMATQLKRNALHFSDSLIKDQSVVEEAQEKLERNFDLMQKERTRLRDHRGKSGSTTCLILASVVVVFFAFIVMFFIIRFT